MNVIKILTIVIAMLLVITLLDLLLVHVILDTMTMGFYALVTISFNHFKIAFYHKISVMDNFERENWIKSGLDQV